MDLSIISPNMLKLFMTCPAKYYYQYVKQIQAPSLDKHFDFGKNIHALASYYLKGHPIEKMENNISEKEKEYWNFLKSSPYFKYEIIGVEKNISTKLDNYWIGGRIDSIVKNNNNYYILDYKTGTIEDDMTYNPQTMVYCLLCQNYIQNGESLNFIYMDLKNKREIVTKYTKELELEYKNKLLNIINKMNDFNLSKFQKPEICKCEYSKVCNSY